MLQAAALVIAVALVTASVHGQGFSPEEAPRRMTVAEGFQVKLVAAEPMVRQPVAIEFDDRGRLWVVQYLQYPNPAGLRRVKVDRYSRTVYDRVPEPPPRGPKGADRITILEATDANGRAVKAKDFVSDLNLATGIAFGHGGVFVLQVPYLLFYPDRNRDDVPDGDPDVLLSGFGMEDAHSVANSLTWGPDGWLYGCQGSTVTAHIRGIEFQQGVWRYHPITHKFELFCEGGGNSWGLDFDEHGNLFYSTNYGGNCMLHGVQGGYYWKSFGKHGALHNPYAYGYFEHVPHRNFHGGHVTAGGIIYQGDSFPPRFRGTYMAADLLGHGVYWHNMERWGSTFRSSHGGELLVANDTWFAPCDVTMGPDGAVYVADWYDKRTAHPDPDADWDRSNGRVYKIEPKGAESVPLPDLARLPSSKLVELLTHPNDWYVRKARRFLADRRDPEVIFPLRTLILTSKSDHLALEALWALYVSGGFDEEFAGKLLAHPNPDIRRWTVRFLGDEGKVSRDLAGRLVDLASSDPDVTVRSQLASTAKRLPAADALPIVERILLRNQDGQDAYIPLLLWWAVEQHAVRAQEKVLKIFATPQAWKVALVREAILDRLMRRYAAEGTRAGYSACARLLASAPDPGAREQMLGALDQGLQDRPSPEGPGLGSLYADYGVSGPAASSRAIPIETISAQLEKPLAGLWADNTTDATLIRLMLRLGKTAAQDRALALARDSHTLLALRLAMVGVLGELGPPSCAEPLLRLLDGREPEALQLAVLWAVQRFDQDAVAATLLRLLPQLSEKPRLRACDVLLSRKPGALRLLQGIDAGKYPIIKELTVDQLRQVALHQDPQLNAIVHKRWGSIQGGTAEEKLAEMRRFSNDLRAAAGSPVRGREQFQKHCASCHQLYGEGNKIGPDLTHANRKDRDFLLASIVDPSAVIRKEYLSYIVQTTDGRLVTGLIAEQTPASITLLGAKNERTTIDRAKIEALRESPVSLMPENLLKELKPNELRDLFSYLQSEQPLGKK
jgi:putative membrane-bound dehydrogenase-like protein